MLEYWTNLTDAQASLLSTGLIVVAGALGVLLSAMLFGGRVNNLETALAATEQKIGAVLEKSSKRVDDFNNQLTEKLGTVDEQFSATLDALGQLRNSVAGLQDAADKSEDSLRDQLYAHWSAVASALEEIASDPKIHGRTRARYSKIPRRTLNDLFGALLADEKVPEEKISDFKSALDLWSWHRNGKPELTQQDVDKMKALAIRLAPKYRP
jgi:septal ring factor EnvC (AmiA/AmiB activator)